MNFINFFDSSGPYGRWKYLYLFAHLLYKTYQSTNEESVCLSSYCAILVPECGHLSVQRHTMATVYGA